MCEVILTVGPRASGKSTFCEQTVSFDPNIILLSRDKIMVELFGSTDINPYIDGHLTANEVLWDQIRSLLVRTPVPRIILDTWNGSSPERRHIIRRLKDLGAQKVIAWYFTTPAELVEEWFWKKPGIAKISEMKNRLGQGLTFYSDDAPLRDHELFHDFASDISNDGFDEIIKINPLTTLPDQVLIIPASV
jgi:predicted kinase